VPSTRKSLVLLSISSGQKEELTILRARTGWGALIGLMGSSHDQNSSRS
jgi:hypothetical protein